MLPPLMTPILFISALFLAQLRRLALMLVALPVLMRPLALLLVVPLTSLLQQLQYTGRKGFYLGRTGLHRATLMALFQHHHRRRHHHPQQWEQKQQKRQRLLLQPASSRGTAKCMQSR